MPVVIRCLCDRMSSQFRERTTRGPTRADGLVVSEATAMAVGKLQEGHQGLGARAETTDDELRSEFRKLNERFDAVDQRFDALQAQIDDRFSGIMQALGAVRRSLESMTHTGASAREIREGRWEM